MALYLDASALMPLFVAEEASEAVIAFVGLHSGPILLSELASLEFAVTIGVKRRVGQLDAGLAATVLEFFDDWRADIACACETTAADFAEAERLVRSIETALRAPDALHVAAAMRLGAELLTLDLTMRRAAQNAGCLLADLDP